MVQHHAQVHLAISCILLPMLQLALHVAMKLHTVVVALLFLVRAETRRHCMCLANIGV